MNNFGLFLCLETKNSKKLMSTYLKNTAIKTYLLRGSFYLVSSSFLAVFGYYFLGHFFPDGYLFGSYFRMSPYHNQHPIYFILIPCFFYSILATYFAHDFYNLTKPKQLKKIIKIIALTIFISSPFGGMLYFYYDMCTGYFPSNWMERMFEKGISTGFQIGWLIIVLSIPYNILGTIICYFLTKIGANLFKTDQLK